MSETEEKKRKPRTYLWLLASLLLAFLSTTALYFTCGRGGDCAPSKKDCFALEPVTLASGENAYYYLDKASRAIYRERSSLYENLQELKFCDVEWDKEYMEKVVATISRIQVATIPSKKSRKKRFPQLEDGQLSENMRNYLKTYKIILSKDAQIVRCGENEWEIHDGGRCEYTLERNGNKLKVYHKTSLLKLNEKALEYYEKALSCKDCRYPKSHPTYESKILNLLPLRRIANMQTAKAVKLFMAGGQEQAFVEALKLVKFGHFLMNCRGSFITYMIGMVIEQQGLKALREMLTSCTLPEDNLRAHLTKLNLYTDHATPLKNAMRSEFAMGVDFMDQVVSGKFEKDFSYNGIAVAFLFQPNKTRRMFAETQRLYLETAEKNYLDAKAAIDAKATEFPFCYLDSNKKTLQNRIGIEIYQNFLPVFIKILDQKSHLKTNFEATRLMFALKIYRIKTGNLPTTLNDLVPNYLPDAPIDDFDGKPLKYLPAKKIFYSIGREIMSKTRTDSKYMKWLTYKIRF